MSDEQPKALEYEGMIEFSKAEGCYGSIELIHGPRLMDEEDLVDALYKVLGLGDGTAPDDKWGDGWYPIRRVKARVIIEILSDVETAPYPEPAPEPIDFDPPPPPSNE